MSLSPVSSEFKDVVTFDRTSNSGISSLKGQGQCRGITSEIRHINSRLLAGRVSGRH